MTKKVKPEKSIAEQIIDEFIESLRRHQEFDAETIKQLQQLAQDGDLRKAQQVLKIIKVLPESRL